jgi:hypothetical protein
MLAERISLPQGQVVKRMITQIITTSRPVVEHRQRFVLCRLNATFITAIANDDNLTVRDEVNK